MTVHSKIGVTLGATYRERQAEVAERERLDDLRRRYGRPRRGRAYMRPALRRRRRRDARRRRAEARASSPLAQMMAQLQPTLARMRAVMRDLHTVMASAQSRRDAMVRAALGLDRSNVARAYGLDARLLFPLVAPRPSSVVVTNLA